jgi:hypothetical protein
MKACAANSHLRGGEETAVGRARIIGTVVGLGLLFAIAGTSTGGAHDFCQSDAGGDTGCVRYYHDRVDSCDREADGHYVRAWYQTTPGYSYYGAWDSNGSQSGCDSVWVTVHPDGAAGVRICEEVAGCSAWRIEH